MRFLGVAVLVAAGVVVSAADPPPKELGDRAIAGKGGYTVGKVTMRILEVTVGDSLQINYRITTDDKAAKVNCKAVRPFDVPVIDNHGNEYRTVRHERFSAPYRLAVSDGMPVTDYFNAEVPIKSAEFLDVDIPGEIVGEKGAFKFRVMKEMWTPKPPPPPKVVPKRK